MSLTDSASKKLARANVHTNALKRAFQRFGDTNPYELVEQIITENGRTYGIVTVQKAKPLPSSFALTVGDACNNLRSVLDHLFSALLADNKVVLHRPPTFPIYDNPSDFTKSKAARYIKKLPTKWWTIIEGAQPYKRARDLLSVLRELNNADKHRMIIILTQTGSYDTVTLPAELFAIQSPTDEPPKIIVADNQRIVTGTELVRVPISKWPSGGDVHMNIRFRFELVFGDIPSIAKDRNVGATLSAIRDEVQYILNTFR